MQINWNQWKLTLPTSEDGDEADEILQPELADYSDENFHPTADGSGIVFRAHVDGATTGGSDYPRSELREMKNAGKTQASWSNTGTGTHEMSLVQAITAIPEEKDHVVAGQIHDAKGKIAMIRLEGKKLFVESPYADDQMLDSNYQLGDKFKLTIQASRSGISVYYRAEGQSLVRAKDIKKTGSGWYFKAGCYTQSNLEKGDTADAYGEVVIYDLTVTHPGETTPPPPEPTPEPEESDMPTKVIMDDSRIQESSAYEYSTIRPGLAYTLVDENAPIFVIDVETGDTVGTRTLPYTLRDPESLACDGDDGLWILDGGNNDLTYTTINLYRITQPRTGDLKLSTKNTDKYVLVFPDNTRRDCEALLYDPIENRLEIISKGSPVGRRFFVPDFDKLSKTRNNKLILDVKAAELVTDATYTRSGSHILQVQKKLAGKVVVLDRDLVPVETLTVDKLDQCESIAVTPDGDQFTYGSEGRNSPLITEPLAEKYQ